MRPKSTKRKAPGRPFVKGDKRAGRPKGSKNKVTLEARAAASLIVDDPEYRDTLLAKARKGTLSPAMEALLWYYAHGKPTENVSISVGHEEALDELDG